MRETHSWLGSVALFVGSSCLEFGRGEMLKGSGLRVQFVVLIRILRVSRVCGEMRTSELGVLGL